LSNVKYYIEKIRGHKNKWCKNKWCSNMYRSNRNKIWPHFSHKYDFFLLQRPYFSERFLELCYELSRYPHTILLCQSVLVSLSPTNSRNWDSSYNKQNLVLPLKSEGLSPFHIFEAFLNNNLAKMFSDECVLMQE